MKRRVSLRRKSYRSATATQFCYSDGSETSPNLRTTTLTECPGSPVLYQTTTPLGGPLGLDAGNRHRNQIIAGVDAVGYRAKWPSRARVRHFYRHFKGIALLIGISRRQAAPMSSRRNSLIRCWTKTTRVAPTGNGPLTVADGLRFVLFAQLLFPSIEPQRFLML